MVNKRLPRVYILGTEPGDPALITIKGLELLRQADVVAYDSKASKYFLREVKPQAQLLSFEKVTDLSKSNDGSLAWLYQILSNEKNIAFFFGNDPYSDPQILEFVLELHKASIAFEIVPGFNSLMAAPLYAGIPLINPTKPNPVTFIDTCGNPGYLNRNSGLDWKAFSLSKATLVIKLEQTQLPLVTSALIDGGKDPACPVALISGGTTWQQKTITGNLMSIKKLTLEQNFGSPLVMVAGDPVCLRESFRWFDLAQSRPLLGKRIVVTRAKEQAGTLSDMLTSLGAEAIEFPGIKIIPPETLAPLDLAISRLESFDWVIFTSKNGIEHFMERLKAIGKDARAFGNTKICTIGPATAAALQCYSLTSDFTPSRYVGESILEEMQEVAGKRILLVCADVAREVLYEGLLERGARVERVFAYRQIAVEDGTAPGEITNEEMARLLEYGAIDLVTFASSNTLRNFAARLAKPSGKLLPDLLSKTRIACIGPITAGTAREMGLTVNIEASKFTLDSLVDAIALSFKAGIKQPVI